MRITNPEPAPTHAPTTVRPRPTDQAPSRKPGPQNKTSTRPSSARNRAAPYLGLKQDPLWPNRTKPDLTEHLTKIFPLSVRPSSVTSKDQPASAESKLQDLPVLAQLSAPAKRGSRSTAKRCRRTTREAGAGCSQAVKRTSASRDSAPLTVTSARCFMAGATPWRAPCPSG